MVDRPGAVLRFVFRRFFAAIGFGEAEAARIRAAAARGPVVYVLRTVSYIEYLYFNYALARHGLPLARYANGGVRTVLLWPVRIAFSLLVGLWRLARGARLEAEEDAMARRLEAGDAVLLFLRPPTRVVIEASPGAEAARIRGRFTETLIALQRRLARPLELVPLTLLWGHPAVRPGGRGALSALFGEPEAPGRLRGFLQFVRHHRSSVVKVAEPIDLEAFLREDDNQGRSDAALARRLRFELSGAIERERRAILGPPAKNPGRVRTEVLRSRRLAAELGEIARRKGVPRAAVFAQAARNLKEIAANPKHWMFDAVRRSMGFVFGRIYDGVDIDAEGFDRVREAARKGPLVLLPSHKSHIDYLVLSWVFYLQALPPPHIAAGANLSFWPLGWIFRRCAAFFLRRSFRGDAVYAAAFAAYVRRLLRDGHHLEFFIEGGRSRTGKVLSPKLGLLGIVADAVLDGDAPAAQAVPVAITYEKVVEEGSYAREMAGGEKQRDDLGALLRAGRVLGSRYGRVDVQLGEPFPLDDALAAAGAGPGADPEARKQAVRRLGHRVAHAIAQATAITPSALVAAACLATGSRGLVRRDLDRRVGWLAARARANGARFGAALTDDFPGAIHRALDLLASAGDLELRGSGAEQLVLVAEDARPRLEFYKNNAIHALGADSIVARAILASGAAPAAGDAADVRARALAASRLLKNELTYRPGVAFDTVFAETRAALAAAGWAREAGGKLVPAGDEGAEALRVLAGQTGSYLDAYGLLARTAREHPRLVGRELVARAMAAGERALLLGELDRREALSRPTLDGALDALREAGAFEERERLAEWERALESVAVR